MAIEELNEALLTERNTLREQNEQLWQTICLLRRDLSDATNELERVKLAKSVSASVQTSDDNEGVYIINSITQVAARDADCKRTGKYEAELEDQESLVAPPRKSSTALSAVAVLAATASVATTSQPAQQQASLRRRQQLRQQRRKQQGEDPTFNFRPVIPAHSLPNPVSPAVEQTANPLSAVSRELSLDERLINADYPELAAPITTAPNDGNSLPPVSLSINDLQQQQHQLMHGGKLIVKVERIMTNLSDASNGNNREFSTIQLRVKCPDMMGEDITIGTRKNNWRVEKRYEDFQELHRHLQQNLPASIFSRLASQWPKRNCFSASGCAPSKMDQRMARVERYIDTALSASAETACRQYVVQFLVQGGTINRNEISADMQDRRQVSPQSLMEGYLTKRGRNWGWWKRRYFVLRYDRLDYYDSLQTALQTVASSSTTLSGNNDLASSSVVADQQQQQMYVAPIGRGCGTIYLRGSRVARQKAIDPTRFESQQFRHSLMLIEAPSRNGKVYQSILCAQTDRERDSWVRALSKQIAELKLADDQALIRERLERERLEAEQLAASQVIAENLQYSVLLQKASDGTLRRLERTPSRELTNPFEEECHQSMMGGFQLLDGPVVVSNDKEIVNDDCVQPAAITSEPVIQYSPQIQSPPTQNPPPSYQPVEQTKMQPIAPTRSGTRQPPKKTGKRSKRRANNATDVNRSQDSKRDSISSMASQLFGKHHHLSAAHHNNHPQKMPLFGAPLVESIAINGVQSELPTVVFRCLEYLNANQAQMEEGIYRISGGSTQVQFLKSLFDKDGDVDLLRLTKPTFDVHTVASLLKTYLRELPPGSILTTQLGRPFFQLLDRKERMDRVLELAQLVKQLPVLNYTVLRTLVAHLIDIISCSEQNKMTMQNVVIVFSPTLGIPAALLLLMLSEFSIIFSIDTHCSSTSPTPNSAVIESQTEPAPINIMASVKKSINRESIVDPQWRLIMQEHTESVIESFDASSTVHTSPVKEGWGQLGLPVEPALKQQTAAARSSMQAVLEALDDLTGGGGEDDDDDLHDTIPPRSSLPLASEEEVGGDETVMKMIPPPMQSESPPLAKIAGSGGNDDQRDSYVAGQQQQQLLGPSVEAMRRRTADRFVKRYSANPLGL